MMLEGTEEIYKQADLLIEEIKKSQYYQNYIAYQQKVFAEEALKDRLFRMKKRELEMESRRANGEAISDEEEKSMSDEYINLLLSKELAGFLENERMLIHLLAGVYERISQRVELNLDYMETEDVKSM